MDNPTLCSAQALRAALLLSFAALGGGSTSARGDGALARPSLADLVSLVSPATPGSAEPHLAASPEGRVWLSWLETRTVGGHALRVASLVGARWSKPLTVAEGDSLIANWADFPTVLPLGGERLAAHFPWRTVGDNATEVRATWSVDGGHSWKRPIVPHRDGTPTEHGFVSLLPAGPGMRVVWLDGRGAMAVDGMGRPVRLEEGEADMTLRTAVVGADGALAEEAVLDPRACDCCQTAAVLTAHGALVAYRDRSNEEIRDIALVRLEDGAWSKPERVHADGWTIEGCPVNGPALAASGERVAVAWYTAAQDSPRVLLAFSDDGGHHFNSPIRLDGGAPLGRVSVLLDQGGGALVAWLETREKQALFQVRRVGRDGALGGVTTVARAGAARAIGYPSMALSGDRVLLAWTEPGKPSQVRTASAKVGGAVAR